MPRSKYLTKKQEKLLNLAIDTLKSVDRWGKIYLQWNYPKDSLGRRTNLRMVSDYPEEPPYPESFDADRLRSNVKTITKCLSEMGVVLTSVYISYNNSKTDFSSFDRLFFRIKRGRKNSNKDRLDTGSYLVTGRLPFHKKGRLHGEPKFKAGFVENGLQITKLPPPKRKNQTPTQYQKVIESALDVDLHPAFLADYVLFIWVYAELRRTLRDLDSPST